MINARINQYSNVLVFKTIRSQKDYRAKNVVALIKKIRLYAHLLVKMTTKAIILHFHIDIKMLAITDTVGKQNQNTAIHLNTILQKCVIEILVDLARITNPIIHIEIKAMTITGSVHMNKS